MSEAWKRIIIEGFVSGFILAIAIQTGISIDETDLQIMVLETVCEVTEASPSPSIAFLVCGLSHPQRH